MNHFENGQTVLNEWTAVRVAVVKGWVYGVTEREGYSTVNVFVYAICERYTNDNR